MREIDSIWIDLTIACNQGCVHCCCNVHERPAKHCTWEELEALAKHVYGIRRIHLTGGEPTAHPKFGELVPKLKALFGCEEMTIWTNGFKARENAEAFKCFDVVYATRYDDNEQFRQFDNHADVQFLVDNYGATFLEGSTHVDRARRGSGEPCGRGTSDKMIIYSEGRLFPCCVMPGIPGSQSVAPSANWKAETLATPMPCSDCWFSP